MIDDNRVIIEVGTPENSKEVQRYIFDKLGGMWTGTTRQSTIHTDKRYLVYYKDRKRVFWSSVLEVKGREAYEGAKHAISPREFMFGKKKLVEFDKELFSI